MIHNYESKQTFADIFKKKEKPLLFLKEHTLFMDEVEKWSRKNRCSRTETTNLRFGFVKKKLCMTFLVPFSTVYLLAVFASFEPGSNVLCIVFLAPFELESSEW